MPRTIPAALETDLQQPVTTMTQCIKLKRRDGLVLGFTMFDSDIALDLGDGDGLVTYHADSAMSISAFRRKVGLAPDNAELAGVFESGRITEADLSAGRWNFCEGMTFQVNWADLSHGAMKQGRFKWGEVKLTDTGWTVELLSLDFAYETPIGRVTEAGCWKDLGGVDCKVRVDPPAWAATTAYSVRLARDAGTGSVVKPAMQNGRHFKCTTAGTSGATEPAWNTTLGGTTNDGGVVWTAIKALKQTGTVTAVTDARIFTASGISLGADHWTFGPLTWLTGLNAGLSEDVKDDNGAGLIETYRPNAFTIAVGDTFAVTAGCDHSDQGTNGCRFKFDNIRNDGGDRFMPGADVATNYGDASGNQ